MAENGCCSGCNELDDQVRASTLQTMRIFGAILIIVSVIEFGIGAAAHGYLLSTKIYLGSWWAGLAALLTGICGVLNKTRGVVTLMITFGTIASLIAVAGAIIDAIASAKFQNVSTCLQWSSKGSAYIGDVDDYTQTVVSSTCPWVYYNSWDTCYCISSSTSDCLVYPLNREYDCADFMKTLPKLLRTSAAMCSVLALCSLVLVSIGFLIVCCSPSIAKGEKKGPPGLVDNIVVGVNSNDKAF